MRIRRHKTPTTRHASAGFTLLEVMIAAVIFTIGMIGVLSLFSTAIQVMQATDDEMIARQKANEAMEAIVGARNSAGYSWAAINNAPAGIFIAGETPLRQPGPDGLVNTNDDLGTVETIQLTDGKTRVLNGFTREVVVAPAAGATGPITGLRQITVTIRYPMPGGQRRAYSVTGFISQWN